jgi:hypothetical protein
LAFYRQRERQEYPLFERRTDILRMGDIDRKNNGAATVS